jgi:hypothetical protein
MFPPALQQLAGTTLRQLGRRKLLLLFLLLVLFAGVTLAFWRQEIGEAISALTAQDGQIIVGSPTVYTRQRLVNDRLSQTAWLEAQLSVTKMEENPVFRSIDQVRVHTGSATGKLGLAIGADGAPARDSSSAPEISMGQPSESKEPAIPAVEPTTSDLLRAKNSYREEVRALPTL